ncbi:hypothetical protein, partial [Helicobacter ailurogastricus]|uniref:hypothetical protein n=1 Tax=Helicobacter ailurogastricus TaxID=1578720 RepID=UPI0013153EF5
PPHPPRNSVLEEKSKTYHSLKKKLLKAKGLVTGKAALKELLKNHADALKKEKDEIADHLGFLTINKRCDRQAFKALLFYFLASPIFKADEIEMAWVNKLVSIGSDQYSNQTLTHLCNSLYQKNSAKDITLDFDTLHKKPHDFGKLVCLYYKNYGRYNQNSKFLDENNREIKQIGQIFITRTLKVTGDDYEFRGKQTLQCLELDL